MNEVFLFLWVIIGLPIMGLFSIGFYSGFRNDNFPIPPELAMIFWPIVLGWVIGKITRFVGLS